MKFTNEQAKQIHRQMEEITRTIGEPMFILIATPDEALSRYDNIENKDEARRIVCSSLEVVSSSLLRNE